MCFTNKEQLCQSFWQSVKEQKFKAQKKSRGQFEGGGGGIWPPPPPLSRLLVLKIDKSKSTGVIVMKLGGWIEQ